MWRHAWLRCLECAHEHLAVFPDTAPALMECSRCGRMACAVHERPLRPTRRRPAERAPVRSR